MLIGRKTSGLALSFIPQFRPSSYLLPRELVFLLQDQLHQIVLPPKKFASGKKFTLIQKFLESIWNFPLTHGKLTSTDLQSAKTYFHLRMAQNKECFSLPGFTLLA